jgi:hypothetical protein
MFLCARKLDLIDLFEKNFGSLNFRVEFDDGFNLVGLATPVLQEHCPGKWGAERAKTKEWLDANAGKNKGGPVVVLSHIPLESKSRWSVSCDSQDRARRKGYQLRGGRGISYQNVLDRDLTDVIVNIFQPDLVLSGDAHDLCEMVLDDGRTFDITLPSFSWLEGTYHHGYLLLEILSEGTIRTTVCWQPQQLFIYTFYIVMALYAYVYLLISGNCFEEAVKSCFKLTGVVLLTFCVTTLW